MEVCESGSQWQLYFEDAIITKLRILDPSELGLGGIFGVGILVLILFGIFFHLFIDLGFCLLVFKEKKTPASSGYWLAVKPVQQSNWNMDPSLSMWTVLVSSVGCVALVRWTYFEMLWGLWFEKNQLREN